MEASSIGETGRDPKVWVCLLSVAFRTRYGRSFRCVMVPIEESGGNMDLKGKVAVVTGGNGGLGQRICHALAAQGCHIAVVYAQSKAQAEGVVKDLEKHQVGAAAFACDVTSRDQVQAMVDDVVKRFGRLDILINDAAYNKSIRFQDLDGLSYEEWTKIIDINLTGPMLTTKAAGAVMKKQGGGRIVNISSVAGLGPTGSSIAY